MKYGRYVGWGVVIYAIMYLAWAGMSAYGFSQGILPRLCELVVLLIVTTIAGRSLDFDSWQDILPYSLCWSAVVIAFDAVFIIPFNGLQAYGDWHLWVGYILIVLLPLLAPLSKDALRATNSNTPKRAAS